MNQIKIPSGGCPSIIIPIYEKVPIASPASSWPARLRHIIAEGIHAKYFFKREQCGGECKLNVVELRCFHEGYATLDHLFPFCS